MVPVSCRTPPLAIGTVPGGRSRQQYPNTPLYGRSRKQCREAWTYPLAGKSIPSGRFEPFKRLSVAHMGAPRRWAAPSIDRSPNTGDPPPSPHNICRIWGGAGGTIRKNHTLGPRGRDWWVSGLRITCTQGNPGELAGTRPREGPPRWTRMAPFPPARNPKPAMDRAQRAPRGLNYDSPAGV